MGGLRSVLVGAAAGAAGTTALNAVTYLDMAVRARPTSSTPEDTVEKLAQKAGTDIPGSGEDRDNRLAGLGPLSGIVAGVGVGTLLGVARGLGWRPSPAVGVVVATVLALIAGNGPMTALGITDPREWDLDAWISDVVPHLAYGAVVGASLEAMD
ncbi:MAG: hypothetical protein H0T66_14110 [Geodermatophilaceae bacterium]|nr:hypothetical protein [Geodermatophilaceae bacterium]MDQ3455168.1 hypothetical protein [Actinomycetota bacterium]